MFNKKDDISIIDRMIPKIGIFAIFFYIISIAIPAGLNIAVFFVSVTGVLVAISGNRNQFSFNLPLVLPVSIFVILSILSISISIDFKNSLSLTMPLIPAVLVYFLIIDNFNLNHIKWLYMTFSIVSLIISIYLLLVFLNSTTESRFDWIDAAKHPLLVVPNDLILLSLITPFSFSLIYLKPRSLIAVVAAVSILLSISIVVLFQSRGSLLILLLSLGCAVGLLLPKRLIKKAIFFSGLIISIILLLDMTQGFVLFHRFINDSFGRLHYWLIAWNMFLDAPFLGNGIHTFWLLLETYSYKTNITVGMTSWVHNLYIETLAEQGIVGFISLLAIFVNSLWLSWQNKTAKQEEIRILGIGAFAVMVGFCIASIQEITFIRYWCIMIFFSLLAIITVLAHFRKNN
jgi:O-antigen ligase